MEAGGGAGGGGCPAKTGKVLKNVGYCPAKKKI